MTAPPADFYRLPSWRQRLRVMRSVWRGNGVVYRVRFSAATLSSLKPHQPVTVFGCHIQGSPDAPGLRIGVGAPVDWLMPDGLRPPRS